MGEPPSRLEWALEGELVGHTPAETIAYLDWCDDYAAEQQTRRRGRDLPMGVISPDGIEPRAIGFLRRIFRR